MNEKLKSAKNKRDILRKKRRILYDGTGKTAVSGIY